MVRFNYSGTGTSSWAMDNITLPPPPDGYEYVTYDWSPDETLTPDTGKTVVAKPLTTTTYTVTTYLSSCQLGTSTSITVNVNLTPPPANAGEDITTCYENNIALNLNATPVEPGHGTGTWSVVSGPSLVPTQFSDVHDPKTIFRPAGGWGVYVLRWTIGNAPCPPTQDEVTVTLLRPNAWHGGTPGAVDDWHTETNWCGGVPNPTRDANIPPTPWDPVIYTLFDADCQDLNLYPTAKLTIKSNAHQSGSLIIHRNVINTGKVTYERFTEHYTPAYGDRFYMVSSPVSGQSWDPAFLASYGIDPRGIRDYNESSNHWGEFATSGTFEMGNGYMLLRKDSTNDIKFTGQPVAGPVSIPVASTVPTYGWNSVGNPYTSAIKIAGSDGFIMTNKPVLHPGYEAVYLWNDLDEDYWVINLIEYYNTQYHLWYEFGTFDAESKVQVGQGFLVNIIWPSPSNPTIQFNRSMQEHSRQTLLKSATKSWPGVTLLARHKEEVKGTIVTFFEGGTTGLDPGYDAGNLSVKSFQLYTHHVDGSDPSDLAIQTLPDNQYEQLKVPVGIECPSGGEVTFSAEGIILPEGVYPILEDKLMQTTTPLRSVTDQYSAILPVNTSGTGRFYLSFGGATPATTVDKPGIKYSAWFGNGKIVIFGTGSQDAVAVLYDMNGRKIGEFPMLKENRNEIPVNKLVNGMYILHIRGAGGTQVIKVPVVYE